MPALELLGRRWHIAADDLPLPSLMGASWHLAILVLCGVDLAYSREQLDISCPYRAKCILYLSLHVFCFVVNSVLHTWTLLESVRGTMFQVHRRRRVAHLVLAVIVFYCLTIASNVYGTWLIYSQRFMQQCKALPGQLSLNHIGLTKAIVITTWISLFIGFVAIVITLNLFSTYRAASTSRWLSRFRLYRAVCFCCFGPCSKTSKHRDKTDEMDRATTGRNMSPMVVIANIFAHIFGGVDMVLTDYMAAFTLLGVQHGHSKPALTYTNTAPPRWLVTVAGGAEQLTNGSWREASSTGVILQPPSVECMVNCCSGAGTGQWTSTVLSVNNIALEVGPADTQLTAACKPITTSPGTDGPPPDSTVFGAGVPMATTTSVPRMSAGAAVMVTEVRPLVNGGIKAAPSTPQDGCCVGQLQDVDAVACGMAPPGCPLSPQDKHNESYLLCEEWDSGDLAQANASEEVLEEALYYMRFAMAVYGWKMFLWMNRLSVTNCCRLCVGRSCGCCRQSSYFIRGVGPDYGPSEGCCTAGKLLEREAITQLTQVPDDDILYVCYDNHVGGLLPYYIALDRQQRSVVVGIRGSLSLSDVVTDLLCEPAEYDVPGVPSTDVSGRRVLWAHRGMMEATGAILRDIGVQGVLRAVVVDWPEGVAAQQQLLKGLPSERARVVAQRLRGACSGYRVVVTGHSLGAGVTGLLGPLLQKEFPNLRCWAFAPPGGLMSPKAAELTQGFCISVTHAKDMIPRLGVKTTEALMQDLLTTAARSRVNKSFILGRLVLLGERAPLEQLFLPPHEPLTPELQTFMDKYDNRMRGGPSCMVAQQFEGARDFVPPGHMLYVERRKRPGVESPCCSCNVCLVDTSARNADYVCRWIRVQDLMSKGLVVSRSMFLDHLPDNTLYAMQMALRQMRGEPTPPSSWFSFERGKPDSGAIKPAEAPSSAPGTLRGAAPDAEVKDSPV